MAQKKNSNKDLEKRVVKLKKKVAALTTSLNKKQSDLSRVLSSVQKKVDKLRKLSALKPPPAPQKKRVQKLRQTTESILGRLKDLEQTVSIIERAGDQLRERTDALESRAAEAMHRGGDVFKPAGPPGEGQQLIFDQLRDRAQAMEKQLGQLSGAQEGLELQVALLSREAEDGDDPTPVERAAGVSSDRSKALLSGQEALQERVEQLEQSLADSRRDSDAADARDLARRIPELQTQCSQTEEATGKLNRRAAVLESHYEALAKKDEQISALLEAMERRLKALAPLLEKPETAAPKEGLPKTLAQQIALLSTDRSLNQTRIDEVVKRAEDLEKTGFSYTRHTDALADRIKRLDNRLDSLKTEDRLNDLNRRGDTLERALEVEKERLNEVQRAGQQTDERLDAARDDIAVLQDRVQDLHGTGEQLDKVIGGLGEEFSDAGRQAKQQQELLQAHAAQLEKQREDQEDAVASNKKANQALGAQLAALDEARQAQQDAADSLRVQQVRHEHDTQNLQKQLKQRTLAGLLLLLAAGALVYLFMRGTTLPQDIQSLMQAGSQADREAASAIAALEKDMGSLRLELSAMNDSLAQVSHSVDLINAAETPEPGAEAGQFAANVASLEQQDREQTELLRQLQAQQEQRHAELLQGQQQLQQQDVELQKDEEALRTELERVAAEVEEVLGKQRVSTAAATSRAPQMLAMTPLGASPEGNGAVAQIWSQAQAAGRWTLQMGGFHRQDTLSRFVQSNGLEKDTVIHQTWFQGKKWYVVLHGIFDTVKQAKAAAAQLPSGLVAQKPWVRGIPPVGELFRP